ncbi:hypothetical protein V1639_04235 [Pseudarthrobacter sp. J75]|uniref:hypothetical protein n=1 Tax=unclassified Pseudarthrobacter TaxID=2647000 RepID=UPI002E801B1A|nr:MULTISPECIES: hypothetical protein [unclassified Pseudarthrobacter]MEE2523991.1 hypothetical protein [Pseudarthrobacter sp. J47]MEE2528241.1 hypothetical protein [Pseudarthrobacter sp. J75]
MSENELQNSGARFNRRSVVKGAAWSVPVIAAAIAAPAASASVLDAGAFSIDGNCGVLSLGLLATGLELTASPTAPIPAGTIITITGTGVANIGVFSVTGGTASVSVLSPTSRQITLTSDLPAGSTLSMSTLLDVSVGWTLTGTVTLPAGYIGTGSKSTGSVSGSLLFCNES